MLDLLKQHVRRIVEQQVGFVEGFAGDDFDTDYWDESISAWEYDDSDPGEAPLWKRYPPFIEAKLESMSDKSDGYSSNVYMYRPGNVDCEGMRERNINIGANGLLGRSEQASESASSVEHLGISNQTLS